MNKLFLALGLIAVVFGQAYSATLSSGSCTGTDGLAILYHDNTNEAIPTTTGVVANLDPLHFNYDAKLIIPGSNLADGEGYRITMGGYFEPATTGSYMFRINCDDGDLFILDGKTLINDYSTHSIRSRDSVSVYLHAGQKYLVAINYFNNGGTANFTLTASFNGGGFVAIPGFKPCAFVPTPLTKTCTSAPNGSKIYYFTGSTSSETTFTGSYFGSETFTGTQKTSIASPTVPLAGLTYPFSAKMTFAFRAPSTGTYRFAIYGNGKNQAGVVIGGIPLFFITAETTQNDARISGPVDLIAGEYYSFVALSSTGAATNWRFTPTYSVNGGNFQTFGASVMRDCQQHGVVTPYRVSIATAKSVAIPVYLRTAPTGKVSVIVRPHDGVTVNKCILHFDATNWNIPQIVAAVNTADGQLVDFTVSSTVDPNYDGTDPDSDSTTMILGTPSTSSSASGVVGAMCTSWGDPHVVSFDGLKYDNQGFGDYYLVRTLDSNFVVQARQGPCGSGLVACQYGMAIKFGLAVFHLYFDSVTGVPSLTGNPAAALYGDVVSYNAAARRYTLSFPNAYSVVARIEWWPGGATWYISTYISVPTDVCGTRGVCGFYDNDAANDFMLKDGTVSPTLSTFLNEYIVPNSEKLLNNVDATIPTLPGVASCTPLYTNCTVDPTPPPPPCTSCVPPPPPPCTTCTCDITETQALTFCNDLFITNGPGVGCPGINVTSLVENCVVEVVNMCDYDAAGPGIEYYTRECCLTNPSTCPDCDSNCNGKGNCNAGTCECIAGYSGPSCVPDGTPCSASATPSNPGVAVTQITVSGAFFPSGKSVTCVFTDKVTSIVAKQTIGTAISEFQATCPLPSLPNGQYLVTVKDGLSGDNCGAEITKSGSGSGDPHFFGFNGEKMEVKKDDNAANQIYHLYCSESVTISTLFYEYPDKLLFMTRFWVRLGETMFTLNLSPVPKIVTSHEPAVFVPELGRFRIEIPDGHLEWDDSKLRVVYKYLRINFSNHIYLNGDAYMNIDFSGVQAPTETNINGIIGRTVYNRLTNEEFAQYEQFRGSVSDVVSFTCPL